MEYREITQNDLSYIKLIIYVYIITGILYFIKMSLFF